MPDHSWYPLLTAIGFLVLVIGMLFHTSPGEQPGEIVRNFTWPVIGGVIAITGMILWSLEGPGGYHLFPEEDEE